jgi:formiminotetrahydrofolate cyclodeaminase
MLYVWHAPLPLKLWKKCCTAIDMHRVFAAKGSHLAVSDAGVGVEFCKAALKGASLNVFINTKAMKDRAYARNINERAYDMLKQYEKAADEIFDSVLAQLE